jgi:hypothetical protein
MLIVEQVFVKEVHYPLRQWEYSLIYDMRSDDEWNRIHNLLYESKRKTMITR